MGLYCYKRIIPEANRREELIFNRFARSLRPYCGVLLFCTYGFAVERDN
jgi:hypothetical protein